MRLIDADALIAKAQHEAEGMAEPFKSNFAVLVEWLIDKMQPIKPEQRWIPVSERLPDLDKYSHGKIWEQEVLITGYFSFDDKKELFISEELASDVINNSVLDIVVVAWMPYPKPYVERKENDN